MRTIETFCPAFPGFYGTHFEIEQDEERTDEPTRKEYLQAMNDVARNCCAWVSQELDKTGIVRSVEFQAVVSPREYNFTNDTINCKIKYSIRALRRYLDENSVAFDAFCKERFSSRPGFCSFFPNEGKEYTNDFIKEKEEALIGVLLEFVLFNEDDECEEYMLEYVQSNGSLTI